MVLINLLQLDQTYNVPKAELQDEAEQSKFLLSLQHQAHPHTALDTAVYAVSVL
jgi:hypothetical protein